MVMTDPDINELIAVHVMGWYSDAIGEIDPYGSEIYAYFDEGRTLRFEVDDWDPVHDANQALKVIESLVPTYMSKLSECRYWNKEGGWVVVLYPVNSAQKIVSVLDQSLSKAICLAVLKARDLDGVDSVSS